MAMVLDVADCNLGKPDRRLRKLPATERVRAGQMVPYHHGGNARADLSRSCREAEYSQCSVSSVRSLVEYGPM